MKQKLLISALSVIFSVYIAYSFETSADSSNPFNEFLNPTKGVDLFTGNVIYTQNLFTLSGRNGLDIDVSLYYSSNIYSNVRSRNDINPTSWVGLGWELAYGSIICDHKNTIFMDDDEYEYISPTTDREKMHQKYDHDADYGNDEFFIKSNPYLKFRRKVIDSDIGKVVAGWIVTTTSGKIYKYGDLSEYGMDTRKANWNTFCWYGNNYYLNGDNEKCYYNYGYVGNGFSAPPETPQGQPPHENGKFRVFGYRWDLSQIEDLFGNKIRFYYEKTTEPVAVPGWNSGHEYTKASYLVKILNPQGQRVQFFIGNGEKYPSEYLDKYTFNDEPDAFMENYEDKFLDYIDVYNVNNMLMKRIELSYDTGSVPVPGIKYYTKRKLKEIKYIKIPEFSVPAPGGGGAENVYDVRLDYNTRVDRAEETDYHWGALNTIKASSGGTTEFSYSRIDLIAPASDSKKELYLNSNTPEANTYGIGGWQGPGPLLNNAASDAGRLSEGIEYIVYAVDRWYSRLSCILWDGEKWQNAFVKQDDATVEMKNWEGIPVPANQILKVNAGEDYFIVRRSYGGIQVNKHDFNYLQVFDWDKENKMWKYGFSIQPGGQCEAFDSSLVYCGKKYFVVAYSRLAGFEAQYMKIFYKKGDEWAASREINLVNSKCRIMKIYGNDKYFLVIRESYSTSERIPNHIMVFNINSIVPETGEPFACTFESQFPGDSGVDASIGENFFIVANKKTVFGPMTLHDVSIYNWDGFKWQRTFNNTDYWDNNPSHQDQRMFIRAGENCAIIGYDHAERILTTEEYYPYRIEIRTWKGNEWTKTNEFTGKTIQVGPNCIYLGLNIALVGDFIATSVGTQNNHGDIFDEITLYKWENVNGSWGWFTQVISGLGMQGLIYVIPGNKYVLAANGFGPYNSIIKGFSWNGTTFKPDNFTYTFPSSYTGQLANWSNAGDIVSLEYSRLSGSAQPTAEHRVCVFKRYQDKIAGPLFSYVVSKKTVKDGINHAGDITTDFTYPASSIDFNTKAYSFKNGQADIIVEGNKWGKTSSFFYNDFFQNSATHTPDYLYKFRLNGYNRKNEHYRHNRGSFNKLVSREEKTYTTHKNIKPGNEWPEDIYHIRTTKTEKMIDNITNKATFDYFGQTCETEYPDKNGVPKIVRNYNSNGENRTSFSLYAFEVPTYQTDFETMNMLTQPAMTLTLEENPPNMLTFCPYNWYSPTISYQYIRKATAITWLKKGSIRVPNEFYTWKANCDNTGKPAIDFNTFDFTNPQSNIANHWQLEHTVTRYNSFGQVVEIKLPNSAGGEGYTYYSTVYRNDLGNEIASVSNSKYDRCAFFTCDYDMNQLYQDMEYFDLDNGWYKFKTLLPDEILELSNKQHFGKNTIYVKNSFGPAKGMNFDMLAAHTKFIFSAWVCPKENTGPITLGVTTLIGDVTIDLSQTFTVLQPDKWQLLTNVIDLPDAINNLFIWVGNKMDPPSVPSDFYVDDIRIYPKDALATTTYYHPQWNKNIVSVDENNNPGEKLEYDGFRRPVKWYKMRHNESDILVTKKEFHHRGFE